MVAAIATTPFDVNPESHVAAVGFANTVAAIATGLLNGQLLTPGSSIKYDLWVAFPGEVTLILVHQNVVV
jgi:hypothetical protein